MFFNVNSHSYQERHQNNFANNHKKNGINNHFFLLTKNDASGLLSEDNKPAIQSKTLAIKFNNITNTRYSSSGINREAQATPKVTCDVATKIVTQY